MITSKELDSVYRSERVKVEYEYDQSDRRHLTHYCLLYLDGQVIAKESWHEDDDFSSCSEEKPNTRVMWLNWVEQQPQSKLTEIVNTKLSNKPPKQTNES